ncbi:MAG: MATE family efflux transporter [Motiliproteus sp.]|nr:MATE family efflux transporter [Motiliproteus sp.]MCW9051092.1 MATE family efflux transporter [Motiliproteus sp.]
MPLNTPNLTNQRFSVEIAAILKLGTPIIITQVSQAAMGFTDTLMAGRYGDTDLAAIAIGGSLWMPVLLAMTGILLATTPMVAQAYGSGDNSRIRTTIQQGLWLALLLGLVAAGLLWLSPPIFQRMEVEPSVAAISTGYLEALSWGFPAAAAYQVLRSTNEALHQTKPIMLISLLALGCNIPLNYVLIYGEAGFPELGGVGCGWATALVMWMQLLVLWLYSRYSQSFNNIQFWKDWQSPRKDQQLELLWLGVPIGVSIFIEVSMFAFIALFLAPLGAETVAGHQITISFTTLVFMIPLSLSMALTIRCGYAIGLGQPDYARFICKAGLLLAASIATLTSTGIYLFSEQIASIYTNNETIQQYAITLLVLACIFQFSDAIQVNCAGALRGYKDTRVPLIAVFIAYWLIGLPLGYSLSLTGIWGEPWGARGFWTGLIAGLSIAAVLLGWRLYRVSSQTGLTLPQRS